MLSLVVALFFINFAVCDDLVSVVVIYRHGDRTPVQPYPTDPYRNASYWPVDFGQLTNLGKMQQYLLGKWLRARYSTFLSPHYSEKDFYLRSTDTDRTLMSAEANLAGLFPPIKDQVWDPAIPWQPIPIHTEPELQDTLLAMKKNCPRYNLLVQQLYQTPYFVNISRNNAALYTYLTENAGTKIQSLEQLEYLYSTLEIERLYNFTLPDWTKPVFPDKMKEWAELSFATPTFTPQLARLKVGTLFNEILEYFDNATRATSFPKFKVFSAHDITISNVLNAMGAFQYHCPPYTSTILFELHQNSNSHFIRAFYKNSSVLQNITLKGCELDCNLDTYFTYLNNILISRKEWELECQLQWYYYYQFGNLQYVVYVSAALSFLVFTLSIFWIYKCCKNASKQGVTAYTQLPNDEVA